MDDVMDSSTFSSTKLDVNMIGEADNGMNLDGTICELHYVRSNGRLTSSSPQIIMNHPV